MAVSDWSGSGGTAMNARSTLRIGLPLLLTAAVLSVLLGFLWQNRAYIAGSYSVRPAYLAVVAGLVLATLGVRGLANRLHFAPLGVRASTADWFRLVTVTSFTNYLPLSAGLVAKAIVLKRVHDMPYRQFAVAQSSLLILIVATNGTIGLAVLAFSFPEELSGVIGIGFVAMAATGLLLVLPARLQERLSVRWFPFAANVGARGRGHWPGVVACQAAMLCAAAASLMLCFAMGESSVGFAPCLLFTAAAVLTRFVTVVPGALGVREFLIGGLAVLTGFDLRDAVVASTLARVAEIVVVFALGGFFTFGLSRELAGLKEAANQAKRATESTITSDG